MAILVDQLTLGEVKILTLDADPRTGLGYAAEIGSYATINNQGSPTGEFYIKVGSGNTDWERFSTTAANGTVNSGVAGRLALYPATGNTVDDIYVQNSQNIDVNIVAQPTRIAPIEYTVPNPGDAITAANFVLTEGAQTIYGAKTFEDDVVVNANFTVNGTLTYLNTVNTDITDRLVTLNKGGAADSGGDTGIEIEENALITGYWKTEAGATSNAWLLKAPDSFEAALDLSPLTADRVYSWQDRSGYVALQTPAALTQGSVVFVDVNLELNQDNANFFWDDSNDRLGLKTNSPQETLHVAGNVRVSGAGSNIRLLAESDFQAQQATVNTTDATVTTLATVAVPTNSSMLLEVRMVGRRTGGTSGSAGDAANYIRTARFKNVAGTVTMHNLHSDYTSEDQSTWNGTLDVSGTSARARVTGAANNNVTWEATILRMIVD